MPARWEARRAGARARKDSKSAVVTAARLVHSTEEKEAPPKSLKEMFRGALEAPQPREKPWAPTAGY